MTLKKLAAGSGYQYLTRQVAAADSTELGSTPLADYYAAKGEAPGRWIGSGLGGISGLEYGDVVTAEQMKNLFGDGCDPMTGAALGRAFQSGSVAGFDLTFSPAKSVRHCGPSRRTTSRGASGKHTTLPSSSPSPSSSRMRSSPAKGPAAPDRSRPAG